jgi:hypothetical protein
MKHIGQAINFAALLGVGLLLLLAQTAKAASNQEWENYIDAVVTGGKAAGETAAAEFLPPGVGDIAQALRNSPAITKTTLSEWLRAKMTKATIDDDMSAVDRYQAFYTCLNGDCSRVQALTAAVSRQSSVEAGTNRKGSDYSNFNLSSADPNACESACTGDQACKAWTYVRPGVQGPTARCWLKNQVPNPAPDNCCTSGRITN